MVHKYEHDTIEATKDLCRTSTANGTAVEGGYLQFVQPELEELFEAVESGDLEQVRNEFGDVLANVIRGGLQIGIEDPLACLQMTVDKCNRRFDYIAENIVVGRDHPNHRSEVVRLWKRAKELE